MKINAIIAALLSALMMTSCTPDNLPAQTTPATTVTDETPAATTPAETDAPEETTAPVVDETTPFGVHGALSVKGSDLVDSTGAQYQLYGMSTHGIAWYPQFINLDAFKTLRDDWNTNCVRLAMYTAENMGYNDSNGDKEYLKKLVKSGVDYATELGMYVIIDWHVLSDKDPNKFKDEALKFFEEMSALYADHDNVIYEICNEPNGSGTWDKITTYANEVIPVIRKNDANAVIICGTPTWSQDIDKALDNPLNFDNVMYALHFYAATHTDWLRQRVQTCKDKGLPIIVSEFGTCDASGNGRIDYNQSDEWKKLIEDNNISYFCWNLANKNETSSVLPESCTKTSGWTADDLSDQGKWILEWFTSETNR